jgi:hypothetical protein
MSLLPLTLLCIIVCVVAAIYPVQTSPNLLPPFLDILPTQRKR